MRGQASVTEIDPWVPRFRTCASAFELAENLPQRNLSPKLYERDLLDESVEVVVPKMATCRPQALGHVLSHSFQPDFVVFVNFHEIARHDFRGREIVNVVPCCSDD